MGLFEIIRLQAFFEEKVFVLFLGKYGKMARQNNLFRLQIIIACVLGEFEQAFSLFLERREELSGFDFFKWILFMLEENIAKKDRIATMFLKNVA